jgi:hypothetical protein
MAFMTPQYSDKDFVIVTDAHGESEAVPVAGFRPQDLHVGDEVEFVSKKFFARLSAPCFLDSTSWLGPFDSLEEAKKEIRTIFEVDPDTGSFPS